MTLKRLPWFELSICLVMMVVGWALNEVYGIKARVNLDYETREKEFRITLKRIDEAAKANQDAWSQYVLNMQDVIKVEDVAKMQDAIKLRDEYLSLAQYLQTNNLTLANKNLNLSLSRKNTNELESAQRDALELSTWIHKQQERTGADRLDAKSQELKARIGKAEAFATNEAVSAMMDLGSLLNESYRACTNYLAALEYIEKWMSSRPDYAQNGLAKIGNHEQELLKLARLAQTNGLIIKAFVEARQPLQFAKAPRRDQISFAPFESSVEDPLLTLRYVLYALTGAFIGLGVFVMMGLYRRIVVTPLHLKLVESETIIEQQNKLAHFGQLAAGLAHEIRNPLTAISARLHTLQKNLAEGSAELQDAAVIRNEIRRLDKILQDFLTLARPAEPKLILMSAEPLLKKTHELLATLFETQSVHLTLGEVAEGNFRGDEQQLKQVLINLIQNAAESMDGKGGGVVLRARKDRAKLKGREADAIIIEVGDDGPGIPPEIQERLFDPFFSTKEHGTGLGLAIAARIVDKHGGALTFDTHLNRGTTFGIVLPLSGKVT